MSLRSHQSRKVWDSARYSPHDEVVERGNAEGDLRLSPCIPRRNLPTLATGRRSEMKSHAATLAVNSDRQDVS